MIDVSTFGGHTPFATYTFEDVTVTSNVIGVGFDGQRTGGVRLSPDHLDVTLNGQTFHSCFDVKAVASCS